MLYFLKEGAFTARCLFGLLRRLRSINLPNELSENIIDTQLQFRRNFQENAIKLFRELLPLLGGDYPRVVEIALIPDEDDGDVLRVLHAEDLLPHVAEVVEAAEGHDGVHQDEALPVLHVEVAHGRELLGPRSVEDLEHALLAVDLALLAVGILDRGVVLFNKDPLDEKNGDG